MCVKDAVQTENHEGKHSTDFIKNSVKKIIKFLQKPTLRIEIALPRAKNASKVTLKIRSC